MMTNMKSTNNEVNKSLTKVRNEVLKEVDASTHNDVWYAVRIHVRYRVLFTTSASSWSSAV